MSDGSTTPPEPESDGADAVEPPPAPLLPDGIVPPPPVFDRDRADAVVPPPPAFDSPLTGSLPPVGSAPPIAPEDEVVPPPPAFRSPTGEQGAGLRRRSTVDAADSTPPPVFPDADAPVLDPAFAAPERPSSGNYRGLTAGIFVFLALLFAGAIALGIYLATSTTLEWPSFDDASPAASSAPEASPEASADPEDSGSVDVNTLISEPCSDFCTEVALAVGADVDDSWTLVQQWTTNDDIGASDVGASAAEETATSAYGSSIGPVYLDVRRFGDDALAAEGFQALGAELGEPTSTDPVYQDGTGTLNKYQDESGTTYLWVVPNPAGNPWVMSLRGEDADDVHEFYLALPI